ncbi:hypothetical protein NFC81_03730 [Salinispirillum sp. LH 10-3-1]|uniref:Fibronectin type-III domain-containing protein n=1 Tax=Salinispirillum sp. LH 10-3-1 TaxID=2952525 RepID=A0AB38YIK4_9GAMM
MTLDLHKIIAFSLTLALAACNVNGNESGDSDTTEGEIENGTEPEPLPELNLSLTADNAVITVNWNQLSFTDSKFNLCLAEEPLTGGVENCLVHNGAQYEADITPPYTLAELTNNQPYWVQLEAAADDGRTRLSSVQTAMPEDPDAAPGIEAERVLERRDLGFENPNRIFSAGPYAIVKKFYGLEFWASLGSLESTTEIALDDETYTTIRRNTNQVHEHNGELYFLVDRTVYAGRGADIWKTDGTSEGTRLVVSGNTVGLGTNPSVRQFASIGDRVAFVAYYPSVVQDRIFFIDSETEGGAFVLPNFQPYNGGVGDKLIGHQSAFYASSSQAGNRSLHRINPETGATTEVWSMGGSSSNRRAPSEMISVGNSIYFKAIDDDGPALWRYLSGTGSTTRLFNPDPDEPANAAIRNAYNVTVANERLYFFANHYDEEITTNNGWRFDARLAYSDGTSGSTAGYWKSDLGNGWTVQDILNRNTLAVGNSFIFESPSNAPDDLDRRWWISNGAVSGTLPVLVDGETVRAESNRERSVSAGEFAWITDSARQGIYAISGQSAGNYRLDQKFGFIDNLTLVGNALWFTACPEGGFSNCTAVWRVVPDTDEQDDANS